MFTSLIGRAVVVVFAATAGVAVFAQSADPASAPAPSTGIRQLLSELPPGVKPRIGRGERLSLQSASGASQVVRLYSVLDTDAFVMLPTGELEYIELGKARPTTDPFVAATAEEMLQSLKAAGLSKYKVEKGQF